MLEFGRAFHVSLHYHLLSFLDIGRDAASIWNPRLQVPEWAEALTQLYLQAPLNQRMALQIMPLHTRDTEAHLDALTQPAWPLLDAFAVHFLAQEPHYAELWNADTDAATQRIQAACEALGPSLDQLRKGLWQRKDESPPTLYILDVPAMSHHGRALAFAGIRCCAVSLAQPPGHILCQILHEECHAISDAELYETYDITPTQRDTRTQTEGYELHRRIEDAAIALGAEMIAMYSPEYTEAYERWQGRFRRV